MRQGPSARVTWPRALDDSRYGAQIVVCVASQASPWGGVQVAGSDHDQANPVRWDQFVPARVVERTLQAAMHTADGQPLGLVKVRNRLVVLALAVLHDQVGVRPVAVNRQPDLSPGRSCVAKKPVKAMLPNPGLPHYLVAQLQNVELVAGLSSHEGDRSRHL